MTKVYACLIGEWVCLNDDPECLMGIHRQDPSTWWSEGADIYAPIQRDTEYLDSLYGSDYVNILYKGKDYRINPIFIQVVKD